MVVQRQLLAANFGFSVKNEPVIISVKMSLLLIALLLPNVNSRSLYAVALPSVVCLSSVTFVRPTQAVQIFGNISTALGTMAIH